MYLNVNTAALFKFTKQLEQMHRSSLPVAIRTALNSAAFDVKKTTMPASAKAEFEHRKPTFFKANSKVEPAQGFAIASMKATVGFVPKSKAVEELEQQEEGGTIENRSLIPMDPARIGNKNTGMVRANARLAAMRGSKAVNAEGVRASSRKQKFIRAAFKAKVLHPNNAFVLGNREKGRQTLSRIDSITSKGGKIKIKRTPLYTYARGGKIRVARTNFMKRAAMESGLSIERHFVDAAIKQFKKFTTR